MVMEIRYKETHDGTSIAASGSSTSDVIDLGTKYPEGFFSLQITLTGDGTAKVEYLLSNDGTNFLEPSEADDILSSFTKISGPGSDGKDMFSFTPMLARFMKIKCTETAGANAITPVITLVYQ